MLEKIVYAGSKESFQEASRSLEHLADVSVSKKEAERVTKRIGKERVEEREATVRTYSDLPLLQKEQSPREQIPSVAAVSMDGGRYQRLDAFETGGPDVADVEGRRGDDGNATQSDAEPEAPPEHRGHWREFKAGCLLTLQSEVHEQDPCPEIPETFLDQDRVSRLAREIHSSQAAQAGTAFTGAKVREAAEEIAAEPDESKSEGRPGAPRVLVRSIVASATCNVAFGLMLAAEAWKRGFMAAPRKAFLSDGASGNWTVWKKYFPSYTPILDFIHLLSHVYAAAMAASVYATGWNRYAQWIRWLWQGETEPVLQALRARVAELGKGTTDMPLTDPRRVVQSMLQYLENNRGRMKYDLYRRQGLPLTSCHMESTVKQINQRVKGTEKFWSNQGGEALLQLRADYLSDTDPMSSFWDRRAARATGVRSYSCTN